MGRKVTVVKEFMFEAAHFLPGYDGPCKNLHGHSYKLQIGIESKVSKKTGMVIDFSKLKKIVNNVVISELDHALLNELDHLYDFPYEMPTAENMVVWIMDWLSGAFGKSKKVKFVRLWETTTSFAEVKA